MKAIDRIYQYIDYKSYNIAEFERNTSISNGYLAKMRRRSAGVGEDILNSILENCPELSPEWLLTGEGKMLKTETAPFQDLSYKYNTEDNNNTEEPHPISLSRSKIPFYNEVVSIGGGLVASEVTTPHSKPSQWIDAGDWFPGATSAICHYGDSMREYPSGSILVLKRVIDQRLIVPGCNYSIETSEYRVTKRLQDGGPDHFVAYSSNTETYTDGKQIHEPFLIPKELIRHIDLILGIVGKEF